MDLSNLKALVKKRKRVGRGGDRGGTSGKGHKGQKARSGPHLGISFEGGQMPLTRRLPKHGFNNTVFGTKYEIVNFEVINKFEPNNIIDKEFLVKNGVIKNTDCLLKVLAKGKLDKKFTINADKFSKTAIDIISNLGGKANIITTK